MKHSVHKTWVVRTALMAMAVALTGCGGGATTMVVPPKDDDAMAKPMLEVPAGLTAVPDQPLSAALVLTYEDMRAVKPSDTHSIKAIEGLEEYGFAVLFVLGDEEVPVPFLETDRQDDGSYSVTTLDASEFGFWLHLPRFEGQRFARTAGASLHRGTEELGYRFHAVFGERTELEDLPMGTANYSGRMYADAYPVGNPSGSARVNYSGLAGLAVDLDAATLTGQIDELRFRGQDEEVNRLDWARLPDTTTFAITDGHIVDGRFAATLSGMDSNEDAQLADTVRGFEGGMVGEFYGPAGEEIGGVLNAMSEAHGMVFVGSFAAGKKGD